MKAVDLFCGCGGFSLGAQMAGMDVRCGLELDPRVASIYRANFGHSLLEMDARDARAIDALRAHTPEVLLGSPPCTDFSSAGPAREGERAGLTLRFAQLIRQVEPRLFVMENVPRLLHSRAYEEFQRELLEGGWSTSEVVVNACWVGVAQSRLRLFVVGSRECALIERFTELMRAELRNGLTKRRTTVREVLPHAGDYIFFLPRNYFCRGVYSTDQPYPTLRANGGRALLGPGKKYKPRNGDAAPACDAHRLTPLDAARLSSFPDTFCWPKSREVTGHAIGNAVPPRLGAFVCAVVLQAMRATPPPPHGGVEEGDNKKAPVQLQCQPRRRRQQVASYMSRWAGGGGAASSTKEALQQCSAMGALVTTEPFGRGSCEAPHGERYVVRYTMGTTPGGDASCTALLRWRMEPGWQLVIKERNVKSSKVDDVFLGVPGYPILFRGRRDLLKLGLLAH